MPEAAPPTQNQPQPVSSTPALASYSNKSKLLVVFAFLFALAVVGFVAFQFFGSKASPQEKIVIGLEREVIRLGWSDLTGVYPNNDPVVLSGDTQINDVVFDKLVELKGASIVPELATKWTNPNSLTWRFDIRKGVKFSSGDELTVEDIKYSFDQLSKTATTKAPWPTSLDTTLIKEVRVVDSDTVEIETQEADSAFLQRLLSVYIVSKKQIEKDGVAKAAGSGPYKVASYSKGKTAELVVNDLYWGAKPKVKKAVFVVYETDAKLIEALNKKEIDYANLGSDLKTSLTGFQVKELERPAVTMLFFNFASKDTTFLKKGLREAIKLSIDQDSLIKQASISGQKANQFLTKSIIGYNSKLPEQKENLEKAKSLLATSAKGSTSLKLYVTPDREVLAKALAKQLGQAGIKVEIKIEQDFGLVVQKLFSGEAQAFLAGPSATDGGEYVDVIFETEGEKNILSYSNKEVDELSHKINETFNPSQRRTLLEQAVEKIMADIPVVPLYADIGTYVMSDKFDLTINAFGDFQLDDITGREKQVTNE